MTQAKIANTSLKTTPDDKAVVVDVYGAPPLNPTNNVKDSDISMPANSMNVKAVNPKKANRAFIKNIISAIDYAAGNKNATFYDAAGNVAGSFNIGRGAIYNSAGPLANGMLKRSGFGNTQFGKAIDGIVRASGGDNLEKLLTGGYDNFNVVLSNIEGKKEQLEQQFNRVKNIKNLTDLSNFVNEISGDNEFIKLTNLGGVIQGLKAVNEVAKEFGLPGVIDRVISKFDDKDKKNILVGLASDSNAFYDLTYLNALSDSVPSTAILAQNPFIVREILANFRSTVEFQIPSKEAALELVKVLNKIDPHWGTKKYGESFIIDLETWSYANAFVRDCFSRADLYQVEMMTSKLYTSEKVAVTAKRLYPFIGIQVTT